MRLKDGYIMITYYDDFYGDVLLALGNSFPDRRPLLAGVIIAAVFGGVAAPLIAGRRAQA